MQGTKAYRITYNSLIIRYLREIYQTNNLQMNDKLY